jgi:hypothetical protein
VNNYYNAYCPTPVGGGYYNPGVNSGNRGSTTGVYYGPRQTGTVNTSPRGPIKTNLAATPRDRGVAETEKTPDTRGGTAIRTDSDKQVDAPRSDPKVDDRVYVPSAGRESTAGNTTRTPRPTYAPDTDRNIRPSYEPRNDRPTRATAPDRAGQDRTYTPTRQQGTRPVDRGAQRDTYERPSPPQRTYTPPSRPSTPTRVSPPRSSSPSRGSVTPSRSGSSSPRSSGGSSPSSSPRRGN